MKSKNSKDINKCNMYLIKEIIYEILIPLNHVFNLCIDKSIYPDNMKDTIIKPIYKNNNKKLIKNYRPIYLLPHISKIFEKIIYNRLSNFIYKHNIINNNQYGFIPNSNTTLSLINIQHFILKNTNNNKKVATIFVDLKKAFDVVDHNILIDKLESYGFRGKMKELKKSYLYKISIVTRINNSLSLKDYVEYGVPQGSVLVPLFYIIY